MDLSEFTLIPELFRKIPVDLMFRYNFVPLRRGGARASSIIDRRPDRRPADRRAGDPARRRPIAVAVGTPAAIQEVLKKTESSQRVLEEATEGFALEVVARGRGRRRDALIDKLTAGHESPIIKLVDTTIFNALQRRASDIHIETRDSEVVIKYRIDGVLH